MQLHLGLISEGNIVEINSKLQISEEERNLYIKKTVSCKTDFQKYEHEIKNIEEVKIPKEEEGLLEKEDKIKQILTDKDPVYLLGKTFNSFKFYITLFFSFSLTVYLFLFYVSAIHSAFFRNISVEIKKMNQGLDNANIVLNSIFNPNALFDAGNEIYILLLAPFLFFGFGFSTHIINESENKNKNMLIAAIIFITFISDSLVAYKIDKSINEITSLISLSESKWVWYCSINFYIVLVMGFIGLIIWSIILHSLFKEIGKKDISKLKNVQIDILKNEIETIKKKIDALATTKSELVKQKIETNNNMLHYEKLSSIDSKILTVETAKLSINSFGSGWIRYLTEFRNPGEKYNTVHCASIVNNFIKNLDQKSHEE